MMKIVSPKLTAIIMSTRDDLKKKATLLREEAEQEHQKVLDLVKELVSESKKKLHASKIKANQFERDALVMQEALSEELELEVKSSESMLSNWNFKSAERLFAELDEIGEK